MVRKLLSVALLGLLAGLPAPRGQLLGAEPLDGYGSAACLARASRAGNPMGIHSERAHINSGYHGRESGRGTASPDRYTERATGLWLKMWLSAPDSGPKQAHSRQLGTENYLRESAIYAGEQMRLTHSGASRSPFVTARWRAK